MASREDSRGLDPRQSVHQRNLFPDKARGQERPRALQKAARRPNRDISRSLRDMRPLEPAERQILQAIGQFRTIDIKDLHHVDATLNTSAAWRVRDMKELGVIRSHYIAPHAFREVRNRDHVKNPHGKKAAPGPKLHVLTLTRTGAAWLRQNGYDEKQMGKLHSGLTKPRETFHDSHLYAMTQNELAQLKKDGATPISIHTDSVLKSRFQSQIQRSVMAGIEREEARRQAAASLNLPIVDGKVMFADVRIEYERENGQQAFTDLELISDTYRDSQIASKGAAGFKGYSVDAQGGFRPAAGKSPWDPDHMARLLGR